MDSVRATSACLCSFVQPSRLASTPASSSTISVRQAPQHRQHGAPEDEIVEVEDLLVRHDEEDLAQGVIGKCREQTGPCRRS
jgi:hypothetical protein